MPNKEDINRPYLDEILRVVEQQHTGYSQSCKKHYGHKMFKWRYGWKTKNPKQYFNTYKML